MGLTSAMVTGLSGLTANQSKIDVTGNNISNVNTVGFKASRLDFKTQFSMTLSNGSPPGATTGGTNPMQIGLGTNLGSISRNFNNGSREVTGVNSHMAIEGDGFFILKGGTRYYTRDGTFSLNADHELINGDGLRVQGYGVDEDFNIISGVLTDLVIPLGDLTVARATERVEYSGNLNADGDLATSVATNTSTALTVGGVPITASDLLSDIDGGGSFPVGATISLAANKGKRTTETKTLTVDAATTVQNLLDFIQGSLGINTAAGINGTASAPGVTLTAAGAIQITGNLGKDNDFTMKNASLTIKNGTTSSNPLEWTKTGTTDGESIYTSTVIYDSLGSPCLVDVVATLVAKTNNGTEWRFFASSPDGTAGGASVNTVVGSGLLYFNTAGQPVPGPSTMVTIDRSNTGAQPALTFNLDFSQIRSLASQTSELASVYQDGFEKGTLTDYAIGETGIIVGSFSNGQTRNLGQVALATFRNNGGLVEKGSNLWSEGPNSGTAVVSAPAEFTAGRIVSNSLELSNVDLSAEFIGLITASTGFSAASRVITTSNQLIQELLSIAR